MGYIDYYDTKELQEKASSLDKSVTTKPTKENKAIYQKYVDSLGRGWRLHQFKQSKQFYATRDVPVLERVDVYKRQATLYPLIIKPIPTVM